MSVGFRRPQLSSVGLLLLVTLYLVAFQNTAFWTAVVHSVPAGAGIAHTAFLAGVGLTLFALLLSALSLLGAGPLLKPALILCVLIAATCSHFMDHYGVVIDRSMITNAMQTDRQEAGELLTGSAVLHMLVFGVAPALLIAWARVRRSDTWLRELRRRALLPVLVFVAALVFVGAQYKDYVLWGREQRAVRLYVNPTYPMYSTVRWFRDQGGAHRAPRVLEQIAADARRSTPAAGTKILPRVVVLVVGETARAANFQLDGYARQTNPRLSAQPGLVNFPHVTSCGTATAVSVPCIFSGLGRKAYSQKVAARSENLLDVLSRTGVAVTWLDNDGGCKGVCGRVTTHDIAAKHETSPSCAGGECHDDILLERLPALLDASDDRDRLIVLHQKGSHGPAYYRRYPDAFRRFTPDCARNDVQNCTREELVNAYDNTIVYTDHVLAEAIALLQKHADRQDAALIYVSDHGESLGEHGVYLHGLPYALAPPEQKQVPLVAWLSDSLRKSDELGEACLTREAQREHSHDDLFDTMLGLFDVSTSRYRRDDDLFGACRQRAPVHAVVAGR
jgi:lipid A ethanolaminephosphotransferase